MRRTKTFKTNLPSPQSHWLLGHLSVFKTLKLDPRPFLGFHQLQKMFGSMFYLDMLKVKIVYIGGYNELKSILNKESNETRRSSVILQTLLYGKENHGITLNSSPDFKVLRRFTLKCLRDLGFGKQKSESLILEETKCLIEELKKRITQNGGRFQKNDLDILLEKTSLNIMWNLVAGERFEYSDKMIEKLLYFNESFTKIGKDIAGKPLGIFPFLKHIPPFRSKYQEIENGLKELQQYFETSISFHEGTLDMDHPRDFIDMYLIEARNTEHPILTKANLIAVCADLFFGGSETTSKVCTYQSLTFHLLCFFQSLMWDFAFMIHHQHIQDAIRSELDEASGDSMVVMKHKEEIPLTEATINEAWRLGNVVGLPPFRVAQV